MRRSEWAVIGIVVLVWAGAYSVYPLLPAQVASHWNSAGEVNGYSSRWVGAFLLPLILTGIVALFLAIPRIDPLKRNIALFRSSYDGFIVMVTLFLVYIYLLMLVWNSGGRFDVTLATVPAVSALYIFAASLVRRSKRNWFIGIRTPWTLTSDTVWQKTNELGARLLFWSGLIALLTVFARSYAEYLLVGPVLLSAVISVVYSFVLFRAEQKNK